jgi:hypothetical protein
MIQAYPEVEFKRLAKAVMDMPVSNADDCKERFPKELPRRLFPKNENLQAQQRCASALSCDGRIPVPKSTSFPPPPPMSASQGSLERERSPYSSATDPGNRANITCAIDDDSHDETPIAIPIERERKPYIAKEGTGKIYDDTMPTGAGVPRATTGPSVPVMPASSVNPSTIPNGPPRHSESRHSRSQSAASQGAWAIPGAPRPGVTNVNPDLYASPPITRLYRSDTNRVPRPRSPSFSTNGSGYGTRSDGNVGDIPTSHYQSNLAGFHEDDDKRYGQSAARDATRRQAEETFGAGGTRTVYDDEYYRGRGGSNGYGAAYAPGYQPQPKKY